jgi:hypothetical protein
VLLAPRGCSGDGGDEGATTVASKMSRHGRGGDDEGVSARRRRGPGNGSERSSRFLDGGPAVAAFEGNKNFTK